MSNIQFAQLLAKCDGYPAKYAWCLVANSTVDCPKHPTRLAVTPAAEKVHEIVAGTPLFPAFS